MHYTLPIFIYIFFTNFRQAFYFISPFRLLPILLSTSTNPKCWVDDGKQERKTKAKNRKKQDGKRKTGSEWETRYKNAELRIAN